MKSQTLKFTSLSAGAKDEDLAIAKCRVEQYESQVRVSCDCPSEVPAVDKPTGITRRL